MTNDEFGYSHFRFDIGDDVQIRPPSQLGQFTYFSGKISDILGQRNFVFLQPSMRTWHLCFAKVVARGHSLGIEFYELNTFAGGRRIGPGGFKDYYFRWRPIWLQGPASKIGKDPDGTCTCATIDLLKGPCQCGYAERKNNKEPNNG